MNKTITVNIGGMVFHIEEQAYEKMNSYLEAVRVYFHKSDGGDEIMQDVEGRIAEVLTGRLSSGRQVVNSSDVDFIIDTMGRPEQIASDDSGEPKVHHAANIEEGRSYRKLYRDNDDKIIAGVCSGLAHRLGVDPIWIRAAFLIMFFAWGSSLIVYLVLAIIMPKAVTAAQKLEMRGEHVTISSLHKASAGTVEKKSTVLSRLFDLAGSLLKAVFKVIFVIAAACMAVIALILLFAFTMMIMAMMGVAGISIPVFVSDLFLSADQKAWAIIALILVIGIPVVALLYVGIRALFGIRHRSKPLGVAALLLFVAGLVIAFWVVSDVAREFQSEGKYKSDIQLLNPHTDTLFVDIMHDPQYDDSFSSSRNRFGFYLGQKFTIVSGDHESFVRGKVHLNVIRSDSDRFELVQTNVSRGSSDREAFERARNIQYNMEQTDSLISFSHYFPVTKKEKFRGQKVRLLLKVPAGKSVHFSEDSRFIIHDIDNVTNTYDDDMAGHTWTMTSRGLECLSCDFSNEKDEYSSNSEIRIKGNGNISISRKGIKTKVINGTDSLIIQNTDDVKISIDENGVVIKKK